ncbi:MAG: alanine racemase [Candidatus Omnitrophica bacterium]|nr:alanine racemase [Candidatus Omnitrophota bacterium]
MTKPHSNYSAWAEIDLKAVRHNYRVLKQLAIVQLASSGKAVSGKKQRQELLAVVKADAYGHGMLQVASAVDKLGVKFLGVSDVPEGILLRKHGIKRPILLFETALPPQAKEIVDYELTPTLCTLTMASSINTYAKAVNKKVNVQVKIDTGMGRLGVWHQGAENFIEQCHKFANLSIKGIYTHFPLADTNRRFTQQQMKQLQELIAKLKKEGHSLDYVHASNSMGLAGYKTEMFNLVRPGLMLYGLYPSAKLKSKVVLKPAMRIKAKVLFVKKISCGMGISYGHTFIAEKDMTVATLPIGYSNGYHRCLSNKASVLINGQRCPVVGRVTMDQIMVDVSHVKSVRIGTEAVVLGTQKKGAVSADELARHAETINYEIVCSLGNQLPRIYKP